MGQSRERQSIVRSCSACGREFPPKRSWQRQCSPRCRQRAFVSWEMLDGSGNPIRTAYLTFSLWNCGGQIAEVIGFPSAIVQQQFTMHANGAGLVTGSVFGNNQISCGNVQSTEWIVQQFKATNQPSGIAQYYCLNAPTTFNPSNAQPCQAPPPPAGFIPLWANPVLNQTWTQPAGTVGYFNGAFDFTGPVELEWLFGNDGCLTSVGGFITPTGVPCGTGNGPGGGITAIITNPGSGITGGGTTSPVTLSMVPCSGASETQVWNGTAYTCTSVTSPAGVNALQLSNSGGTANVALPNVAAGSALVSGTPPVMQLKPAIDVRDWGADCTGATDSGPALNSHTNTVDAITNQKIIIPNGCILKLVTGGTYGSIVVPNGEWQIYGSEGWEIEGAGFLGTGPLIESCASTGSPAAALKIERSGGWRVKGVTIESVCFGGTDPAPTGVILDDDLSGGYTETDGVFDRVFITTNLQGQTITNWTGVQIAPASLSNTEDMRFEDSKVYCQGAVANLASLNNVGIYLGTSFNPKSEEFRHTNVNNCFQGIKQGNGSLSLANLDSGGNGSVYAPGPGSDPSLITGIVSEDNQMIAQTGPANWPELFMANHIGWNGANSAGLNGIDLGCSGNYQGTYLLIGNGSDAVPSSATGAFPLCAGNSSRLTMIGNNWNGGAASTGQTGGSGFMFPAGHTFGSNYSNLNGGYLRFGSTPTYGPTDIGVGFFTYTGGYEVPGLGYAGHNTNSDCQYSGGACYGTDVGYLFNGAITFNGLFPIPPQSIGCSTAGAGTSQNYNVRVFPYDSAGNQVGMDLSGQGNCYLWTAFSGSNTGTLTWPAVARAVSYDVVLMNPAHSSTQGWLAGNTASTSLTMTSGPGGYSYSFPSFTAGARTTINGASLTVNAPTTFNSTLTGTLTGHASLDFPIAGGTLTGLVTTLASASGGAGLNCPQGTAPTSPNNGDLWCTSAGMYGRFNGSTVGPFGTGGGGGTWAGLSNSSPGNLAIPLGAFTSAFTGGDFGASPIAALFQYLTTSTSSTDITPLMAWDTGTSYEQGPIARVNVVPAFSICNAYISSTHTGFSIFGNATGVSTPPCTNGVLRAELRHGQ